MKPNVVATFPFVLGLFLLRLSVATSAGIEGDDFAATTTVRRDALLGELEAQIDAKTYKAIEAKVGVLEKTLRTTFTALPRNKDGGVGASVARYALHRLFVQRHAWQMIGIDTKGDAWESASPTVAMGERMPKAVHELFDSRLSGRGLDLPELAVLAAILETLGLEESEGLLVDAYRAMEVPRQGALLDRQKTVDAIAVYMMAYSQMRGENMTNEQLLDLQAKYAKPGNLSHWVDLRGFLKEVQQEVAPDIETFAFPDVLRVVMEVAARYGRFQASECASVKEELLELEEHPGTGRIRLRDFYNATLHGVNRFFRESAAYLRLIGALDESEAGVPRVIIVNYMQGPNNCNMVRDRYSLCCTDDCEDLRGRVEKSIGASSATPQELLDVVTKKRGLTPQQLLDVAVNMSAHSLAPEPPWVVTPALKRRLMDIAQQHNGTVPLHGRLFAQWMHHVHPTECPYPHMSGTTSRLVDSEMKDIGFDSKARRDEMQHYVELVQSRKMPPKHEEGMCSHMWTLEEELVESLDLPQETTEQPLNASRKYWFEAASVFGMLAIGKMLCRVCCGQQTVDKAASFDTCGAPQQKVYSF